MVRKRQRRAPRRGLGYEPTPIALRVDSQVFQCEPASTFTMDGNFLT